MTDQLPKEIPHDVIQVAQSLTQEENRIALECAQKVLSHLKRHQASGLRPQYQTNIEVLEEIIEIHRVAINQSGSFHSFQFA